MDALTKSLLDKNLIIEYDKNQYVYTEELTKMLRYLENGIIKNIAKPMKFKEWILPAIIKNETIQKYGNTDISYFKVNEQYILDPLRITLYTLLNKKELQLPLKIFERSLVFRNENKTNNLAIQNEFRRLDFFYIGIQKEVTKIMKTFIKQFKKYLETNKIEYTTTEEELITEFQSKTIEIANIGTRKNLRLKQYNAKTDDNIWAGYASIGLDRLVYCKLSL